MARTFNLGEADGAGLLDDDGARLVDEVVDAAAKAADADTGADADADRRIEHARSQ